VAGPGRHGRSGRPRRPGADSGPSIRARTRLGSAPHSPLKDRDPGGPAARAATCAPAQTRRTLSGTGTPRHWQPQLGPSQAAAVQAAAAGRPSALQPDGPSRDRRFPRWQAPPAPPWSPEDPKGRMSATDRGVHPGVRSSSSKTAVDARGEPVLGACRNAESRNTESRPRLFLLQLILAGPR
jgi:hypothetical protein